MSDKKKLQCWTRKRKDDTKYVTCNSNTKKKSDKRKIIIRRKKKKKPLPMTVAQSKPQRKKIIIRRKKKKKIIVPTPTPTPTPVQKPTGGMAEYIVMNNPFFRRQIFSNLSANPMMDAMQGLSKTQQRQRATKLKQLSMPFEVDYGRQEALINYSDTWDDNANTTMAYLNPGETYEDYWNEPKDGPIHARIKQAKTDDLKSALERTRIAKDPRKMRADIKSQKNFINREAINRKKGKKTKRPNFYYNPKLSETGNIDYYHRSR